MYPLMLAWKGSSEAPPYLRPLGEHRPVLLLEEVQQLVLLVLGHHFADSLVILLLLLQGLGQTRQWAGCYSAASTLGHISLFQAFNYFFTRVDCLEVGISSPLLKRAF